MPIIRFSKNWNNKLDKGRFTTIRANPAYHENFINKVYQVELKGEFLFSAKQALFQEFDDIYKIPKDIVEEDTGYPYEEGLKILRKFIGDKSCCLLTLEKVYE